MTHFTHSGAAQEKLHSIQKDLEILEQLLVQDVSTRWNSTYYILATLMERKRTISLPLTACDIAKLTSAQWELLEQLLNLWLPLEEIAINTSSGFTCISETNRYVVTLIRYCHKISTSELTSKLSQVSFAMQQWLDERFKDITISKTYLFMTASEQFKMNVFSSQLQRENAK